MTPSRLKTERAGLHDIRVFRVKKGSEHRRTVGDTRKSLLVCKEIDEDTAEDETTCTSTPRTSPCVLCSTVTESPSSPDRDRKVSTAHFAVLAILRFSAKLWAYERVLFRQTGTWLPEHTLRQSAIALDPTGVLKDLSDGKRPVIARLTSLGSGILTTPTSES